jgi:crotonobetainyl-CoA:carnitine CoA-transferase CaiB-like acyl-CoA transferase
MSFTTPDPDQGTGTGPLEGLVVADFSRVLAGPLASMFLADLGATVIKVERPCVGDDTRSWGPPHVGSLSTYFTSVNRNKRSVTLDLTDPEDLELAHTLVARSDVFIENFRPGKLSDFALDSATLLAAHPQLVYCSVTGFGSTGGAHLPGYDFVVQAVGGLMSITGAEGGEPTKVGVALVDVLTGLHATISIQAALRHRDRTGRGQLVEVNLLSSLIASLVNQGAAYINGSPPPAAMGNQHPSIAPYETLATKDHPIAVAVGNDRQFQTFTKAIGRVELSGDERFSVNRARVANRRELIVELETTLRAAPVAHWTQVLQDAGIPCGPVNDIAEAIALASELGLQPTASFEGTADAATIATLASPLRLSQNPVVYRRPPPQLGADTAEVREWLLGDGAEPLDPGGGFEAPRRS